jgi:hypothetical protein
MFKLLACNSVKFRWGSSVNMENAFIIICASLFYVVNPEDISLTAALSLKIMIKS